MTFLVCSTDLFLAKAAYSEEPESNITEPASNESLDYSDNDYAYQKPVRINKIKKSPLLMNDSAFSSGESLTLKDLIFRVALIVVALLCMLFGIKIFLNRNKFGQQFSFFSAFSPREELKLLQTMILTPGQNIYLVEVDGKKLLLGGTHEGGVQFLTDLTQSTTPISNLSFNQIEEGQSLPKQIPPVELTSSFIKKEPVESLENQFPFNAKQENKRSFNNRSNFRRSLNLSGVK